MTSKVKVLRTQIPYCPEYLRLGKQVRFPAPCEIAWTVVGYDVGDPKRVRVALESRDEGGNWQVCAYPSILVRVDGGLGYRDSLRYHDGPAPTGRLKRELEFQERGPMLTEDGS